MAMYGLINEVTATGELSDNVSSLNSIPSITVMDELNIYKTADKDIWAKGYLTYTITIENKSAIAYTDVEMTDKLDTKITLVDKSVKINNSDAVKDTDYTFINGELKVFISEVPAKADDEVGEVIVTFQVSKL